MRRAEEGCLASNQVGPDTLGRFVQWLQIEFSLTEVNHQITDVNFLDLARSFAAKEEGSQPELVTRALSEWANGYCAANWHRVWDRMVGKSAAFPLPQELRTPLAFVRHLATPRVTATFIYEDSDDFSETINQCAEYFHLRSGENLNVLHNPKFISKHGGFSVRQRFLGTAFVRMPALLLWKGSINQARGVEIYDLSASEIRTVFDRIVIGTENQHTVEQITQDARTLANELRAERRGMVNRVHVNIGGNNSGDLNVAGNNQSVDKITLRGDAAYVINPDLLLTPDARNLISRLRVLLIEPNPNQTSAISAITEDDRLEIAKHVSRLLRANTGAEVVNAGSIWSEWVKSLGDKGLTFVSILSDLVTVTGSGTAIGLVEVVKSFFGGH